MDRLIIIALLLGSLGANAAVTRDIKEASERFNSRIGCTPFLGPDLPAGQKMLFNAVTGLGKKLEAIIVVLAEKDALPRSESRILQAYADLTGLLDEVTYRNQMTSLNVIATMISEIRENLDQVLSDVTATPATAAAQYEWPSGSKASMETRAFGEDWSNLAPRAGSQQDAQQPPSSISRDANAQDVSPIENPNSMLDYWGDNPIFQHTRRPKP